MRLVVVGLGQRLLVQGAEVRPVPGLGRPVRLVVRRGRQRALLHLVEVAAGAPEVDRERQLEVVVAVVVRVVLDVDVDAGGLGLRGEDGGQSRPCRRRRWWCAGRRSRPVLARRLEQRLGLVDVLLALRAGRVVVAGVERRVEVVGRRSRSRTRSARSWPSRSTISRIACRTRRRRTAACRSPCRAGASRRSWRSAPRRPGPCTAFDLRRRAGRSSRRSGRRAAR